MTHTSGIGRGIEIAAIALGAVALTPGGAFAAPASLSIKRGEKIVIYTRAVTISGRLSTHEEGVRVGLAADRFPFDSFRTVASTTTGEDGRYRFKHKPTLGTRYRAFLRRNPSVRSPVTTVYLNSRLKLVSCNYCEHGPDGHGEFTFRATVESRQEPGIRVPRVYFYWGLVNGDRWPPEVRLRKTIQPKQLAPGKVRTRVRYRFHVPNREYSFFPTLCARDHFARNGWGIPGHHHCGDARIDYPAYTKYLG
ncbi:MAG TPA: hypothetical protein VJT75_10445 [Thermoleophilaceae bacterium]|nr:hypothetical protein [Thermoleophilaceae bacterium]